MEQALRLLRYHNAAMPNHDHASTLSISCPAKVNLALSVGAPDPNGYHAIASWMTVVTFSDEMKLQKIKDAKRDASSFDLAFDKQAPKPGDIDWPIETDLTFRAHALLQQHVGEALPMHCALRKRIPAGAGLGGGSADAAGMLVGLRRLFELDVSDAQLIEIGRRLGSDVAFAICAALGQTSALVTGLGETAAPAPLTATIHLVLIFPPLACPTGEVYRAYDRLTENQAPCVDVQRVRAMFEHQPLAQDAPFNDLTEAAFTVSPRLRETHQQAQTALSLPVHMTGSGSTLFVIAPSALTATVLARKATALTNLPAVSSRTM